MGVHSRHDSDAMSEGGEALPFLYPPPTKEVARCVVSRSRKKIEMEKGEDANERKRERDYCKVRTRMEKRFSPLPEPSETETARYQGCKEQAEDVNCLVTFPVQPEPGNGRATRLGPVQTAASIQTNSTPVCVLSPRLFYPFPTGVWLPGTRECFVYIYIYIPSRLKPLSFRFSPLLPPSFPSFLPRLGCIMAVCVSMKESAFVGEGVCASFKIGRPVKFE